MRLLLREKGDMEVCVRRDSLTSVIVPVSVRVPVLVLELTVVLGHKSDLEGIDADLRI